MAATGNEQLGQLIQAAEQIADDGPGQENFADIVAIVFANVET
jgi:hypothetical protein